MGTRETRGLLRFSTILVGPKYEGNIGFVARCMVNFGLQNLILVNGPRLGDEAYRRAMRGAKILDDAIEVNSFEEARELVDFVIGTTGITTDSERKHLRCAVAVREFAERLDGVQGVIGLAFGREDYGLFNEELRRCDLLLNIPTSERYPVMNISHAAAIVFYELAQRIHAPAPRRLMSGSEKEKLLDHFESYLDVINYPVHKKRNTLIMFRRLIGRAMPSKTEFHTLMGVFNR